MVHVKEAFIFNAFTARWEHAHVLRVLLFDMIKYSFRTFTWKNWLEPSYSGVKVSWETAHAMGLVSTIAKVKKSAVAHTTDLVRFIIWSRSLGLCDNRKLIHFNEVDVNINFFAPLYILSRKDSNWVELNNSFDKLQVLGLACILWLLGVALPWLSTVDLTIQMI